MQNKDDDYLRWVLRSPLFPVKQDPHRQSKYPIDDGLNFEGTGKPPTPISEITKTEKQNNIAVNVFGWKGYVIVHRLSKQPSELPRINLMVIEKEEKGLRFHYT